MMNDKFYTNTDDLGVTKEAQLRFYAAIGLCVTEYQSIEDRLDPLFRAIMKVHDGAADAILSNAKRLEDRLKLIGVCLEECFPNHEALWIDLSPRIKQGADNRNQIAHSTTALRGRGIVVHFDEEKNVKKVSFSEPQSQFEAIKETKSGRANWNTDALFNEFHRLEELGRHMTVFFRLLVDGSIPLEFQQWWDHPNIIKLVNS